jgi:hypothetical protein
MLILKNAEYEIIVENDDTYTSGSADNARSYDSEYSFNEQSFYPSSKHSVTVKSGDQILGSRILLADGGTSGVHEHSALLHKNSCVVAVGPFMCSLRIPSLELEWKAKVDMATCFGVYYSARHHCFISHGELEISRVEHDGRVLWKAGGKDIFTNGFELHENHVEVVDWNNERYHVDIETGESRLTVDR